MLSIPKLSKQRGDIKNSCPVLVVLLPAVITPYPGIFDLLTLLPVNRFPNKLAPNVPNNILRNKPFCSIASFLIVSLTLFIRNPDSSRD